MMRKICIFLLISIKTETMENGFIGMQEIIFECPATDKDFRYYCAYCEWNFIKKTFPKSSLIFTKWFIQCQIHNITLETFIWSIMRMILSFFKVWKCLILIILLSFPVVELRKYRREARIINIWPSVSYLIRESFCCESLTRMVHWNYTYRALTL